MLLAIEWTASALSMLGALLVARQNKRGFILWTASNALWIAIAITNRMWGMAPTLGYFTATSIYGLKKWK